MATTYSEDGTKKVRTNELRDCPSGFARDPKTGKCVQLGVGPEYRP